MDLSDQLAAIWSRRWAVLALALIAAVAVFAWRSTVPERYDAGATVMIRLPSDQTSDPTTAVGYYAGTVVALATNRSIVQTALHATDRKDDVDTAVDLVSASTTSDPGFVEIDGFGPTGAQAADLANALASAVISKVASDQREQSADDRADLTKQIADLDAQINATPSTDTATRAALTGERDALVAALSSTATRSSWQVETVEPAQPPGAPSAPQPKREAGLTFLVALLLFSEGVVLLRAWRGQLSVRDPAGSASALLGLPAVAVPPDARPGTLASLLPMLTPAPTVTVAHRGEPTHARTAVLIATLLSRRQDVLLVDGCPRSPSLHAEIGRPLSPGLTDLPRTDAPLRQAIEALPKRGRVRVLTAGDPKRAGAAPGVLSRLAKNSVVDCIVVAGAWDRWEDLVAVFGDMDGPVLLEVNADTATHRQLRADVEALRGLGADVAGLTLVQPAARQRRRTRRARVASAAGGGSASGSAAAGPEA